MSEALGSRLRALQDDLASDWTTYGPEHVEMRLKSFDTEDLIALTMMNTAAVAWWRDEGAA